MADLLIPYQIVDVLQKKTSPPIQTCISLKNSSVSRLATLSVYEEKFGFPIFYCVEKELFSQILSGIFELSPSIQPKVTPFSDQFQGEWFVLK